MGVTTIGASLNTTGIRPVLGSDVFFHCMIEYAHGQSDFLGMPSISGLRSHALIVGAKVLTEPEFKSTICDFDCGFWLRRPSVCFVIILYLGDQRLRMMSIMNVHGVVDFRVASYPG